MSGKREPDPDDATEDELAAQSVGQATTVEEAMDAATPEDGHVAESAYTPAPELDPDDPAHQR